MSVVPVPGLTSAGSSGGALGGIGKALGFGGGGDARAKHAWQMAQGEYWHNRWGAMHDPYMNVALQQARGQAKIPWLQVGKQMGMHQADIQSRALQEALSARGGGNLADALSMGSQARVGAGLQGLQAGFGMKQQALGTLSAAAQARLSLVNQLYGALQGVSSSQIGAGAQIQSAQIGAQGQMWGALMSALAAGGGGA